MMKKVFPLLIAVFLMSCVQDAHATITLSKDFNSGSVTQGVFNAAGLCNPPFDGYLSSDFAPDGGKSFRAETKLTDVICGGSKRSEMHVSMIRPEMISAEWFAFDTYVPASQPDDTKPEGFAQYHSNTSAGSPPWGLWYENGAYKLVQSFAPTGTTPTTIVNNISGSYPKGQWHKWIVHYKRSLGSDGLIELWVDGQKKVTRTGANTNLYNGVIDPTGYFKFGIYKWVNAGANPSLQASRVVYIDNVQLADSTTTIDDFIVPDEPAVDAVAPSVSMTAPNTGSTLQGSVTLNADANDNIAVTKVDFYVGSTRILSDVSAPYSAVWDTTLGSNSSFLLKAIAYDAAGNATTSESITVTVANTVAPTSDTARPVVSMTRPATGATLTGIVTVSADARDNIGITRVDFYQNSVRFDKDTTNPYSVEWNTTLMTDGSYSLYAVAYDAAGNQQRSNTVSVVIHNPIPDPTGGGGVSTGGGGGGGSTTTTTPVVQQPTPSTPTPNTPSPVAPVPGCLPGYIFSTTTGKRCSPTTTSAGVVPSTYDFGPVTLRNGSRGEGVKELQRFLNRYLNLGLVVDGILGPKTIAVMKTWQRAHNLVPDGLIGPKTKAMMNSIASQ